MRVCLLVVGLEVGGTERSVERLVTGLDRSRFDPLVISLTGTGTIGPRIARKDVPVLSLGVRHAGDLRAFGLLVRTLRRWRPDLIHSFLFHANQVARLAAPCAGSPPVIASHRTLEGGRRHWWVESQVWDRSRIHVCVCERVRRHLTEDVGVAKHRTRVILNGVEGKEPVERCGTVATASRLAPGKGTADMLRATGGLAPVRVIGDGILEERFRREWPSVRFTGRVEDLRDGLEGVSVFVHASRLGEGMPNAVLEAMACGIPVVATDVGGTAEAVVDGETGYLVASGDVSAIREGVRRLLADPEAAKAMGEAGRARVKTRFGVSRMVSEYEALYEEVVGKG